MLLNARSLCLAFFHFLLITFLLFPALQAEASSHAVEFVVDFSESMKEKIDDKGKIEIVQEIFDGIFDGASKPLDAELIFFGHRDKDSCDDAEVVIPSQEFSKEKVRQKLTDTSPLGKGGLISALKKAVGKLDEKTDLLSIIIFTDGKDTCGGDLIKTAREIKEKYDYRVTFYIIGLNPEKKDIGRIAPLADIGYGGTYHRIQKNIDKEYWYYKEFGMAEQDKESMKNLGVAIAQKINTPEIHHPKAVGKDEMVLMPAGEFFMGSDSPYFTSPHERPAHAVFLDSFFIDKYEVTQQQYRGVMGVNPSYWIGSDLPVHNINWNDAKKYCEKIGKRLPTEAEWEKAAKGGRNDNWAGTSDAESLWEYAWIDDTALSSGERSGSRPHPVGTKKPNGYGIYDMSGNVLEWVSDWYRSDYYKTSPKANPPGPEKGLQRILRGGSWDSHLIEVRTATRNSRQPDYKDFMIGFRCARSPE